MESTFRGVLQTGYLGTWQVSRRALKPKGGWGACSSTTRLLPEKCMGSGPGVGSKAGEESGPWE